MDKCWPTPLNSPDIDPYVVFQIYSFEITTTFPKEHSIKCNEFFNKTPTIFGTTYNPILMLTYTSTGINGYRIDTNIEVSISILSWWNQINNE